MIRRVGAGACRGADSRPDVARLEETEAQERRGLLVASRPSFPRQDRARAGGSTRGKLGDDGPDMDAANLHPWAWETGASYWNSVHFHQAFMQAAIRINFETQTKLGRMDLSETALFNDAFSLDAPKEGAPRLRLAVDDGGKSHQNLHRGAGAFADGLKTAIRNPGMQTPPPVDGSEEQLALEQLAAFSLLARWVEQADVEEA